MVYLNGQMEGNIWEIGRMGNSMEEECILRQMDKEKKENGKMEGESNGSMRMIEEFYSYIINYFSYP